MPGLLGAPWTLAAALVVMAAVAVVVRPSADHPLRSALVYAEAADANDAWFGSLAGPDEWVASAGDWHAGCRRPHGRCVCPMAVTSLGVSAERAPLAQPTRLSWATA